MARMTDVQRNSGNEERSKALILTGLCIFVIATFVSGFFEPSQVSRAHPIGARVLAKFQEVDCRLFLNHIAAVL